MKKRRTHRINIPPKYYLFLLLLLCIVLLFVSYQYPEKMQPLRSAIGSFITPMQKGINTLGKSLSDKLENLADISDLIDENAALKEQLDELKYENKMLQQDTYELEEFRSLFELAQKYTNYPTVAARVISRDTNNFYSVFKIDKGSNDGIEVDMNVLAGNGLAGIVTEVGDNWAKVRSIIDDESSVSGMFLSSSDTCIVNGNLELMGNGYIDVEMISANAKIEDNYEIVTSHISDKFFQGILMGYVTDIELDSDNMTMKAHMIPAVDFEHLELVLIITEVKEKTE